MHLCAESTYRNGATDLPPRDCAMRRRRISEWHNRPAAERLCRASKTHIGMAQSTCRRTNVRGRYPLNVRGRYQLNVRGRYQSNVRGRYDRGCTYVLKAHIGMVQSTCIPSNVRGRYPIIKKGIDTKVSIPFLGKYLVFKLYGCCGFP